MYLVPILPPGHYHVQVSKQGFKTIIKADVVLYVQGAVALNFVLPVGATSESITVDSATPALNTTDASVSTVVDQKFVENIPLNGRSFQDLISMTPFAPSAPATSAPSFQIPPPTYRTHSALAPGWSYASGDRPCRNQMRTHGCLSIRLVNER